MPAMPDPGSRSERRRRHNRAALLDAAIELFQQRGVRAVKLEEICERADLSPRTFFNHFETREHLYRAIARQRAAQFAAQFDATTADPRSLADRLPGLLDAIGAYLDARPLYRELVGEMLHVGLGGDGEATRARTLGRAALRFVEDAAARGEATRAIEPVVLADLLLGALTTALGNWSASPDYDLRRELGRAAAALLRLLAPDPKEAP